MPVLNVSDFLNELFLFISKRSDVVPLKQVVVITNLSKFTSI